MRFLFTEGAAIVGFVYLFAPLMILSLVGVMESIRERLLDVRHLLGASRFGVFPPGSSCRWPCPG